MSNKKTKTEEIELNVNDAFAIKDRLKLMAGKANSEQEKNDLLMASSLVETLLAIYDAWGKSKKTVKKLLKSIFGIRSEKVFSNNSNPSEPKPGNAAAVAVADGVADMAETSATTSTTGDSNGPLTPPLPPPIKPSSGKKNDKEKRAGGNGRNSADDYVGATEILLKLEESLRPGKKCPDCMQHPLFKKEALKIIRLIGHAPVTAIKFIMEQSGCVCGAVFTAKVPAEYQDLYNAGKYGPSAIASILVYKYLMAVSFGMLSKVQSMHGVPLPASTQANKIKEHALDVIKAVAGVLKYLSANAYLLGFDDTIIRLLEKRLTTTKAETNRGHGTAVIANHFDDYDNVIVLYDFDYNKHAGDVVIDLLKLREKDKDLPLLISDGLEAYKDCKNSGIDLNCNTHARRKIIEEDPEQKTFIGAAIVGCYQNIYKNDRHCKDNNLSDIGRMKYHNENSKYSFERIQAIFNIIAGKVGPSERPKLLADFNIPEYIHQVEPNDDLAIIANYFLTRYDALIKVMSIPGVPLDTNYVERAIKAIIRIRLNSLFFENLESAKYSGEILSVLETTNLNKINVFIYIEFLITNKEKVIKNPKNYLPWLYDKDDAYKKLYWEMVAAKNRRPANSPEYPFSEQTHSDKLTELQESG